MDYPDGSETFYNEEYVDCYFTSAPAVDREPSADDRARELPKASSGLSVSSNSGDMNPKRRSKSLERLSAVSIKPFPASDPLGSTFNLRFPSNDDDFSRPPRVPPRPKEEVLARFEQQKNSLVTRSAAVLQPGKVTRNKYVNVYLREGGGRRRRESGEESRRGREAEEGARRGREPEDRARKGREAEGTLRGKDGALSKAAGPHTAATGREESSKSRRQRTGGASLQPGKPVVQRCKSSAGVRELPRHQEYTPRRSAALPDSTPNPAETSGTLKSEPPSRPAIKPRKTRAISLEERVQSSHSVANSAAESPTLVIDSRTGTVCLQSGDVAITLPSSNDVTPSSQNVTTHLNQPPNAGDFNQEPQSFCSTSKVNELVVSSENSQPVRPPPPNRKPPTRPPVPSPRPRKPRTPTTKTPDLSEEDQYVHMSRNTTATSLNRDQSINPSLSRDQIINPSLSRDQSINPSLSRDQSINPSLPVSEPVQGEQLGGRPTDAANDSDNEEGAYSYVDLVKNRHLITPSPNFAGAYPTCTHDSEFSHWKISYITLVLHFVIL